jgi:hypothetical protein
MKKIKNVSISPDLVGSLCTIFYEDGSKLAVTVLYAPQAGPLTPDCILRAVAGQLGFAYSDLCAVHKDQMDYFRTEFNTATNQSGM